jgi:hypothetical protein
LQEIRFAIEDATGGREFDHRMMDFNNLSETSFDDVKDIIRTARARVQRRLDLQSDCALQWLFLSCIGIAFHLIFERRH